MKRIVICCDGTWNKPSAEYPTNVARTAEMILPAGSDGVSQLVYYEQGVGTSFLINEWLETRLAGAFGWGLFDKIAGAYQFIVTNYVPGDEIVIFGFSRGSYTARSLAGMLRKCGVIPRSKLGDLREVFGFYKNADIHPDSDAAQEFRMEYSPGIILKKRDRDWRVAHGARPDSVQNLPLLCIKYLGVWDTVGALGIPQHLIVSKIGKLFGVENRYAFHDTDLSGTVYAARHAVAVDEDRLAFTPSLWSNLDELNAAHQTVRYEQLWFPGDHGSVGGGGDIVGLSNGAMIWILEGAMAQGVGIDQKKFGELKNYVDPLAPLHNQSKTGGLIEKVYRRRPRVGPQRTDRLAETTLARLEFEKKGQGGDLYRPATLAHIHHNLPHYKRPQALLDAAE